MYNLKILLIETIIQIIHIDFICIGIFTNNYAVRIYFELVAFFGMLSCVFTDLLFCVLLSIKAFFVIIFKCNDNDKKKESRSLSFQKFPHSSDLQQKVKNGQQTFVEENKIEEKNKHSDKNSSNKISSINKGENEFAKNDLLNAFNVNKNSRIIEVIPNEDFIDKNPHDQSNSSFGIGFPNPFITSSKLDQSSSIKANEKDYSSESKNYSTISFNSKPEEIKKMNLEESKIENRIGSTKIQSSLNENILQNTNPLKLPKIIKTL